MLDWMKYKLESRMPGDINILRYADDHTYGKKWRGTKEPLDESEKESEKPGLKLNIQKIKIITLFHGK